MQKDNGRISILIFNLQCESLFIGAKTKASREVYILNLKIIVVLQEQKFSIDEFTIVLVNLLHFLKIRFSPECFFVIFRFRPEFRLILKIRFLPEPDQLMKNPVPVTPEPDLLVKIPVPVKRTGIRKTKIRFRFRLLLSAIRSQPTQKAGGGLA